MVVSRAHSTLPPAVFFFFFLATGELPIDCATTQAPHRAAGGRLPPAPQAPRVVCFFLTLADHLSAHFPPCVPSARRILFHFALVCVQLHSARANFLNPTWPTEWHQFMPLIAYVSRAVPLPCIQWRDTSTVCACAPAKPGRLSFFYNWGFFLNCGGAPAHNAKEKHLNQNCQT